jgi:O-antigen ligase
MMGDWENTGRAVTFSYVVGEYWINTFKWVVPALLLFDGARSRTRFLWGMASLLGIYVLLGVQVIKWMPPSNILSGDQLSYRALKILQNEIGFSRVNLSMLLGGASWAVLAALPLFRSLWLRGFVLAVSLSLVYAQALTGGRTGYVTWAAVGLLLCLARWRRYLLLAPFVMIGVVTLVPGAKERMMQGFGSPDALGVEGTEVNQYEVTSGRTLIWPYVIEKIKQRPLFGYGREAMARTGLAQQLWDELGESFPHPHNAYLETLFDGGWVGFFCVIPFYLVTLFHGFRLFLDSRSPYFVAAGGVLCALLLALLVYSMGSQTFYPREGSVGMWCAFGLAFRALVERRRAEDRQRTTVGGPRAPRPMGPRSLEPMAQGPVDALRRHA